MRKDEVLAGPGGRVIVADTITSIDAADEGAIVVTGSHGGTSAAEFALAVRLALVVFNDAGVGKDAAGITALERLAIAGVPAAAVSHLSARVGDAMDAFENGVVSHANEAARTLGMRPGERLRDLLATLVNR